jgi:hypothetical protein
MSLHKPITPLIGNTKTPRARIFKLLRRSGIDSKEYIPAAYVAWRAGTTTLFLIRSWPPIDCFKIPVLCRNLRGLLLVSSSKQRWEGSPISPAIWGR